MHWMERGDMTVPITPMTLTAFNLLIKRHSIFRRYECRGRRSSVKKRRMRVSLRGLRNRHFLAAKSLQGLIFIMSDD